MVDMHDKVAVVTGAAQGIGESIAKTLAGHGCYVYVCDIHDEKALDVAEDIRNVGGKALAVHLDVTSVESWAALSQTIESEFGKLDILVNNAGIELIKSLSDTSLDDWRRVISVNVDSIFIGCKQLQHLLTSGANSCPHGSSVVNISSVAGIIAMPNQHAYNTSKGAVRHLSKSLAIEFGSENKNIRVNSVHPGFIQTPMLKDALSRWVDSPTLPGLDSLDRIHEMVLQTIPLGRIGTTDDIAKAVLYLASDDSSYVTGSELVIDGGLICQ